MAKKAIESLRNFAMNHATKGLVSNMDDLDNRSHLIAFAHMCTAALEGEEWAMERVEQVLSDIWDGDLPAAESDRLAFIRETDTTRPDGAIAKSIEI